MGNTIKYFLAIVFFPIVILFWLTKKIYRKIKIKILQSYLNNLTLEKIDNLNGFEFEELLEIIFVSKGYKVIKTQKSHDYGADLIINKNGVSFAIQCKLYFKHSVGNSAIQEASSAKDYYNTDYAIVITNSNFSKPATILAKKIGVRLIDRNMILNLISKDHLELL
jgi:restriction system protein